MLCKIPFSTPTHTDYRIRLLPRSCHAQLCPLSPTHPDCLSQSIAAEQSLQSIHTLLLHSATRTFFPPHSGIDPSYCSSSTPPSCEYCAAIYKVTMNRITKILHYCCSFLTQLFQMHLTYITCFVSNSYEPLCSEFTFSNFLQNMPDIYIYMTSETRMVLVWFLEITVINITILKKAQNGLPALSHNGAKFLVLKPLFCKELQ